MPISEKYKGLEWDAYQTFISTAGTSIYENIGYGVENSNIILKANGNAQDNKDDALNANNSFNKTIWCALQEIKQAETDNDRRQTVSKYGWFIHSVNEFKEIYNQREGIGTSDGKNLDVKNWKITRNSNSTYYCWSSNE